MVAAIDPVVAVAGSSEGRRLDSQLASKLDLAGMVPFELVLEQLSLTQ